MDFERSDEMAALEASGRRLANDEVPPRARVIDRTGEHPAGPCALVRDEGRPGSCRPARPPACVVGASQIQLDLIGRAALDGDSWWN